MSLYAFVYSGQRLLEMGLRQRTPAFLLLLVDVSDSSVQARWFDSLAEVDAAVIAASPVFYCPKASDDVGSDALAKLMRSRTLH